MPRNRTGRDQRDSVEGLDFELTLLAGRSPTGPSLLLRGEPGIGKTSLLDAAAVQAGAAGMLVLRACAVQSEAEISFSALHQLLYPLRERADQLAAGQRDVVDRVFDLAQAASLDALVVSTAVLALLGDVAAERAMLLVVDDVPWLDRASATVLGFVARRLADTPVVFLAAARTGAASFFDEVGLPEQEVSPLDEKPAATLLDTRYPDLAPPVRRRLLDEAAGNPLALRELPVALTDSAPARTRCSRSCRFPGGWRPPSPPRSTACPRRPGTCCCWPRRNQAPAWPCSCRPPRAARLSMTLSRRDRPTWSSRTRSPAVCRFALR